MRSACGSAQSQMRGHEGEEVCRIPYNSVCKTATSVRTSVPFISGYSGRHQIILQSLLEEVVCFHFHFGCDLHQHRVTRANSYFCRTESITILSFGLTVLAILLRVNRNKSNWLQKNTKLCFVPCAFIYNISALSCIHLLVVFSTTA